MSQASQPVLVGQANCLGAGLTYGWSYGSPWELLRAGGFDTVDVGGNPAGPERVWRRAAERERRQIAARGLRVVCYHSIALKPWAPVAANLALQEPHMVCARLKGARLFLVHGLWEDFRCFDLRSRRARRAQLAFDVRTLTALAARAREHGLRLVVENNSGFPHDYYVELLEHLDPSDIGAALDTGHALLQPAGQKVPVRDLIERLGPRIEHLHLNDNDGVDDQHLPVLSGWGVLDWAQVFRALKRAGYLGVLNEELPPMTGMAWTVWALKRRKAQPLRDLWHHVAGSTG